MKILLGSGQYQFVTEEGFEINWITQTPKEWWQKQLWLKNGGHNQEDTTFKERST